MLSKLGMNLDMVDRVLRPLGKLRPHGNLLGRLLLLAAGLLPAGALLPATARAEHAARTNAAAAITTDDTKHHVEVLADDTFEGREAGSRGGRA